MGKSNIRLADIEQLDKEFLRAEDVAPVLGVRPDYIRKQAHDRPELLGFPTIATGNRTLIPKDGFVFFCKYGRPVVQAWEDKQWFKIIEK